MTLSLPDELHLKMKRWREVRWSEIARQAIEKRIDEFEALERIAAKSKLTSADVNQLSATLKAAAARRLKDEARH